jgi:hypothetical protein
MGRLDTLFDEEVNGPPPVQVAPVPYTNTTPTPPAFSPDMFNEDVGGPPRAPPTPMPRLYVGRAPAATPDQAPDWSHYNQPTGSAQVADPSITERVKSYGQDVLMGLGADPYNARKLSEGVVDVGGFTPMGSVLAAGDAGYNATRGNYGRAAIDAAGVIPGAMMVRRGVQAARGGLPMIRMADTPTRTVDQATGAVNDELLNSSRAAYGRIANAPIEYHPNAIANYAHIANYYLQQPSPRGVFSPESAPGVFSLLNRASNVNYANGIRPSDFDTLRQQLRAFDSGPDSAAGQRAAAILENYMHTPPPGAITRMVPGAMDTLRQDMAIARGDWRAGKTAETVERTIDRSGTKSGGAHSGLNVGNTTRQDLGALADPPIGGTDKIFGATYPERQALRAVSQGDAVTNRLRYLSNRMGGGGGFTGTFGGGIAGHTVNSLLGSWGVDPITATAVGAGVGYLTPKVGEAFRQASNERTVRAAQDVVDLIRRNSPLYRAREAVSGPPIVDPRAMTRDAVAYAMIPQLARQAGNAWDTAHIPYDNREQQ